MKQLLLFFLLIFSIGLSAQNYKTINPDRELYYVDTNSFVFAIKIDSINTTGFDTNYYSFKTTRINPSAIYPACMAYFDDSWIGRKIIIKPNGYNIFINEDNDSILINTQAHLNDTFNLYTYPNNNYIKAYVSNIDTATILGTIDSVKTYSLFSNNPSFNLSPSKIKIGKDNGIIDLFAFFKFPNGNKSLNYGDFNQTNQSYYNYNDAVNSYESNYQLVGKSNPKIGVTKLTTGEAYNYNIGDEFNIGNYPNWYYYKILNKYFSINGDTVFYEQEKSTFHMTVGVPSLISIDTSTIFYTNLNNYVIPDGLPEKAVVDSVSFNGEIKAYNMYLNKCGENYRISESRYSPSTYSNYDSLTGCLEGPHPDQNPINEVTYQTGLGLIYFRIYSNSEPLPITYSLTAYKKGSSACDSSGTLITNIKTIKNKKIDFSIFPNPTNSNINYSFESLERISITFFDVSGRIVLHLKNINSIGAIDVSQLQPGIYFITANTKEQSSTKKLIVE